MEMHEEKPNKDDVLSNITKLRAQLESARNIIDEMVTGAQKIAYDIDHNITQEAHNLAQKLKNANKETLPYLPPKTELAKAIQDLAIIETYIKATNFDEEANQQMLAVVNDTCQLAARFRDAEKSSKIVSKSQYSCPPAVPETLDALKSFIVTKQKAELAERDDQKPSEKEWLAVNKKMEKAAKKVESSTSGFGYLKQGLKILAGMALVAAGAAAIFFTGGMIMNNPITALAVVDMIAGGGALIGSGVTQASLLHTIRKQETEAVKTTAEEMSPTSQTTTRQAVENFSAFKEEVGKVKDTLSPTAVVDDKQDGHEMR